MQQVFKNTIALTILKAITRIKIIIVRALETGREQDQRKQCCSNKNPAAPEQSYPNSLISQTVLKRGAFKEARFEK